jgi:hypothetical protein
MPKSEDTVYRGYHSYAGNGLERELLYSWEVVLFAPHFAIVLGGHLE